MILDATIAPQAIRYPADLSLLREFSEQIIDTLPSIPVIPGRRWRVKQQLQYLRRNLDHIERWGEYWPEGTLLPRWLLHRYWAIRADHLRWDAFHQGGDLKSQVGAYRARYGFYPEVVSGRHLYGTRGNWRYLKQHSTRFAGKPSGWGQRESPKRTGKN